MFTVGSVFNRRVRGVGGDETQTITLPTNKCTAAEVAEGREREGRRWLTDDRMLLS